MKEKAAKVVPELIQRGVKAFTQKGLQSKAREQISTVGQKVGEEIEKIPAGTKTIMQPIIDAVDMLKSGYKVGKVDVVPQATKQIDDVKKILVQLGEETDTKNVIKLRQIWDSVIAKTGKANPFVEEATTFRNEATRVATNAIREELAKAHPSLAVVNKEYNFWKNVDDLISKAVEKSAGKGTSLEQKMLGAGAVLAQISGGINPVKLGKGLLTGAILKNLNKLMNSTAWRTTSAVTKNKIADTITSGNMAILNNLVLRIIAGNSQEK
jgi:hypothetical protein